jgi:hypothetical protein
MNSGTVSKANLEMQNNELLRRRFADPDEVLRLIRLAVREAVLDHKRTGDPIVVSGSDGKPVWIPADEIVVPED